MCVKRGKEKRKRKKTDSKFYSSNTIWKRTSWLQSYSSGFHDGDWLLPVTCNWLQSCA